MADGVAGPGRIGRLPDAAAARAVSPRVLQGQESPSYLALGAGAEPPVDESIRWDVAPVVELLAESRERFGEKPTASDAWLAPRLHCTMRMTRAEAADTGVWNFLGVCVAPEFVRWRWGRENNGLWRVAQAVRFAGRWDLQCFSRLWWAAELFRDGSNYAPVELACGNQDFLNTVLRQEMVRHRPTAQALLRLQRKNLVRTGRDINAAASAANAAAATLIYEVLAPDELQDVEALEEWISEAGSTAIPYETLPVGPKDGSVPHQSAERLTAWFQDLFAEAPVRGRQAGAGEEDGR
ncbi:DUF6339 family protein [Streptomyces tremellae]|uniref:Uncharacterized protein n=1 Tax=Streptomyces tremellae TaxID=1124239 RepID=A0ABP7FED5_9ACTN